jgi:SPP1 family phage portal protein
MGYDAKDDRLGGNANQLNIMSMYSDIDLDANEMETEYQSSFEQLLYFINLHLANIRISDFDGEEIEVIFNRDMLINESDIIANIRQSVGILSERTLVANHPWTDDPQAELERLEDERGQSEQSQYGGVFGANSNTVVTNSGENAD